MVTAFNALLECLTTGLVTALALMWFANMGWLPFIVITEKGPEDEE